MAVPRFIAVKTDLDKPACINIESIMSIEEVSSDPAHEDCVLVTLSNGKEFYLEIYDTDLLNKYCGDKIDAAIEIMESAWVNTAGASVCPDAYVDRVDAALLEGETIPVVVKNPDEFRD